MPKTKHSKGYDRLEQWTRMELRRLYQAEGYSTKEAIRMARALYEGIRNLNRAEIYSWNKCKELEIPIGAGRLLHNLTGDYTDTEELWFDIETQCRPHDQKAHYERLVGRQMRLTEEEKETGREDRVEKRQVEKEAQREASFERLLLRATELRGKLLGQKEWGPTTDQRSDKPLKGPGELASIWGPEGKQSLERSGVNISPKNRKRS